MDGKVCIVTGANSGIGKETARGLLRRGATVVMFCRSEARAEAARAEITRGVDAPERASVVRCDLQSYASVRQAAASFLADHDRLDVLVNNAGLYIPTHQTTEDGHEATIQTNHLGHFLLTDLLLDALKRSAPARVVNVSSTGHRAGRVELDDLFYARRRYQPMRAYCDSKLANVLYNLELARRLEGTGVTANALHPGAIGSNFAQSETSWFSGLMKLGKPFLLSSEKGARTSIHLAASPSVEGVTGRYFVRSRPARTARRARDGALARRFFDLSAELVGAR